MISLSNKFLAEILRDPDDLHKIVGASPRHSRRFAEDPRLMGVLDLV